MFKRGAEVQDGVQEFNALETEILTEIDHLSMLARQTRFTTLLIELTETKVEHIEFLRFEAMFVKRELIYIDEGDLSRWFLTAP